MMDYTGLLFECPLKDSVEGCAISEFKKLDVRERFEKWKSMSDAELKEIVQKHMDCFCQREARIKKVQPKQNRLFNDY